MASGTEDPNHPTSSSSSNWWSMSIQATDDNFSSSFTNNSHNNSTVTLDSARTDLVESGSFRVNMEEAHSSTVQDTHMWNQVLMNVGNGCNETVPGNIYQLLSTRGLKTELHEPCDQNGFVKVEESHMPNSTWSLSSLNSSLQSEDIGLTSMDKTMELDLNPLSYDSFSNTKNNINNNLTSYPSDWSLGPPVSQQQQQHRGVPIGSFNSCLDLQGTQLDLMNNERQKQVTFGDTSHLTLNGIPVLPGIKAENCKTQGLFHNQQTSPVVLEGTPNKFLRNCYTGTIFGAAEDYGPIKFHHSNILKHGGHHLGKPMLDFHGTMKPLLRPQPPSRSTQCHNSEVAKKRNSDSNASQDTIFKRPRYENPSNVQPYKSQAPKVKLGDRITALQQLVSPFGKTDTASVLLEAISYIKFLHEQVQGLSSPYMKGGSSQADQNCWVEHSYNKSKDTTKEAKLDLKSRGLCLVPISCTLQVSNDAPNPDYWPPTLGGGFRLNN